MSEIQDRLDKAESDRARLARLLEKYLMCMGITEEDYEEACELLGREEPWDRQPLFAMGECPEFLPGSLDDDD